jgi:hypothetical protein
MGCGYASMDNSKPIIIRDIETSDKNGFCWYYGDGAASTSLSSFFQFRDSCGKYNVGDTVKLTK